MDTCRPFAVHCLKISALQYLDHARPTLWNCVLRRIGNGPKIHALFPLIIIQGDVFDPVRLNLIIFFPRLERFWIWYFPNLFTCSTLYGWEEIQSFFILPFDCLKKPVIWQMSQRVQSLTLFWANKSDLDWLKVLWMCHKACLCHPERRKDDTGNCIGFPALLLVTQHDEMCWPLLTSAEVGRGKAVGLTVGRWGMGGRAWTAVVPSAGGLNPSISVGAALSLSQGREKSLLSCSSTAAALCWIQCRLSLPACSWASQD